MRQEHPDLAVGVRAALPAALLLLTSCYSLYEGRDAYGEGMHRLRYDPAAAAESFAEADRELAEAIAEDDLDPAEMVLAVTLRARSLIELERHADAAALLAAPIQGYTPEGRWSGDVVGLALLRASKLSLDHRVEVVGLLPSRVEDRLEVRKRRRRRGTFRQAQSHLLRTA